MDSQIRISPKGQPASFVKHQTAQQAKATVIQSASLKALARVVSNIKVKRIGVV